MINLYDLGQVQNESELAVDTTLTSNEETLTDKERLPTYYRISVESVKQKRNK